MDEEIKKLLDEEIKAEIRDLSTLEPGSGEKSTAIEDLVKLCRLKIEETKSYSEYCEKRDRRLVETEQVRERYFKLGIAAAEIVLPLMFYAVWMRRGFRFEETGTFTSTTFRGLFNRFRPGK